MHVAEPVPTASLNVYISGERAGYVVPESCIVYEIVAVVGAVAQLANAYVAVKVNGVGVRRSERCAAGACQSVIYIKGFY
jgi:hypothetical protein